MIIFRMITNLLSLVTKRSISRAFCSVGQSNLFFHPGFDPENVEKFANSFLIFENIVSAKEEEMFMKEMEPHLKRHVYEKDHWDDVTLDYFVSWLNTHADFLGHSGLQRN